MEKPDNNDPVIFPAPWRAFREVNSKGGSVSHNVHDAFGLHVLQSIDDNQCGAVGTVNLISAAPELYTALKEALADWNYDHFDVECPYRMEWANKARAALAKARGELWA